MQNLKLLNALVVFILLQGCAHGTIYSPPTCSHLCTEADFIPPLPEDGQIPHGYNRAYAWTLMALIQDRANVDALAPPGIGRMCGILGTCLYEAAALNVHYLHSTVHSMTFGQTGNQELVQYTMDGAGYWALYTMFGEGESFAQVFEQYNGFARDRLEDLIPAITSGINMPLNFLHSRLHSHHIDRDLALAAGARMCQMVIEHYTSDGFLPTGALRNGEEDPTGYHPVNLPQRLAGITDCDNEIVDFNRWQPLCIPDDETGFGTERCTPQTFLYPWAGLFTPFALEPGNDVTGGSLSPPPPHYGSHEMEAQWREVLQYSSELDDTDKIIAEYWADGPDTTLPPGHSLKIAADAAITEGLTSIETARLLFVVGNAVNDAGIASWRTKTTYDLIRPLQLIQCGARGEDVLAWRGPYQGVGIMSASEWRPYQASNFMTPPFSGYVSGHSTFSAAAAEALALFFGDDTYRGPACHRVPEGESLFEPRSDVMPGISDRPNTGPNSQGYVPAEDVVLCWETFTDAADQAGISRLLGGIHISADDLVGRELGRRVGRAVFEKASRLYYPDGRHGTHRG